VCCCIRNCPWHLLRQSGKLARVVRRYWLWLGGQLDCRGPRSPRRAATNAHADRYAELLVCAAVARLDGLLHLDRARQGLGGAVEHDHQPIAEVLDLPSGAPLRAPPAAARSALCAAPPRPRGQRGLPSRSSQQDRSSGQRPSLWQWSSSANHPRFRGLAQRGPTALLLTASQAPHTIHRHACSRRRLFRKPRSVRLG
jgi:hypothetical protein